jgi:D-alanyl-D-alanine carboxypeptidase
MTVFRILPIAAICIVAMLWNPSNTLAAPHIVVDIASGKIVSREDAFDRWYPASLTKLMTVYTVFKEIEKGRISMLSPVRVSAHALAQPPSKMGFRKGTVMNIDTAIKILMVKSANDISVALAESVAGSEQAFVRLMNTYAKSLGLHGSQFANPHGLFNAGQYTTARDMAVLALALRREFPQHAGYFRIPAIKHGKNVLRNHNALLQRFRGTTGMKTGYICESGLNMVATAKRGGKELLAVVLGGPSGQERNVRAASLLSTGFRKSLLLSTEKIETLKPSGIVQKKPVNLRGKICNGKKKAVKRLEISVASANSIFAFKKPTLDELEKRYLERVGHNAQVVPIVLGNATGPDPFGLASTAEGAAPAAYIAESGTNVPWPAVFGSKRIRVPLPTPRPR